MAQSGSFSNTFSTGYTLRVDWVESGVDVATNTSDLTVTAYLVCAGSSTSGYYINSSVDKTISLTINGTTYSGTCSIQCGRGETKTLFTKTVSNIAHNTDGTKSVSISCTTQIKATLNSSYISSASASGTATLSTIARASQPTCKTQTTNTQNVGSFGDKITIYTNRASTAFTHTIRYVFGSSSGTIATGVGDSTQWTIPKSLMSLIPNNTSGSGTIYADTYNGSTLIGTKYCGFTATVPTTDDCYPTCSLKLEVIGDAGTTYGRPVKGLTKVKITVNTTLAYGSPIDTCTITANGKTYSGLTAETDILKTAGSSAITATVKDKRGRTCKTAASYTMNVMDYAAPSISRLAVHRCESDGTNSEQGSSFKISISSSVSEMSGSLTGNKNTATYSLQYKKTTDSSWKSVSMTSYNNVYSLSNAEFVVQDTGLEDSYVTGNDSYDVKLTVTDRHDSATKTTSVSTAFTLINWNADGTGIAFGKVSEKSNRVEFGLPVEGLVDVTDTITFSSSSTDADIDAYMTSTYANMPDASTTNITANCSFTDGALGGGRTHISIYRGSVNYGYAIAIKYANGSYPYIRVRSYYGGAWKNWSGDITERYLKLTGGTLTGALTNTNTSNILGRWAFKSGWCGMYSTTDDAQAATNRQGWFGYDQGSIFTIKDAKSGIDFITSGNIRFAASSTNVMELTSTTLRPVTNNTGYVGDSTYKWKAVYAVNGTIQTSDRNLKKDIAPLSQRFIDLFEKLLPVSFMFNYNESDRTHIGFISQDVEAAMAEVGLTAMDFGGFCRDIKIESIEVPDMDSPVFDEDGNPVLDVDGNQKYNTKTVDKPVLDENGDPVYIYSLRYEEFVALNTKMIQLTREETSALREETASLRAELDELKQLVLNKL